VDAHYFGTDGHGSVRVLYDLAAAIVQHENVAQFFHFDAYGNLLNMAGTAAATSYLYSGEAFDFNIGQQYLRARWYDASTGRFNRLDPFFGNLTDPQSLHKYAYVHGDPIQGVDPTGLYTASQTGASLSIGTFSLAKLSTALGFAFTAVNTYFTVQNIIDTAAGIANGDIGAIMKEIDHLFAKWTTNNESSNETVNDINAIRSLKFWQASANSFTFNAVRLLTEITKTNIPVKLPKVFLNRKSRVVIQLPTPRGIRMKASEPITIPGRVQLGVLRAKLAIQIGATGSRTGRALGIAVQEKKNAPVRQIFRQDFHPWDGIDPKQKDIRWQEASPDPKFKFHYHVDPNQFANVKS
jgi:RHS repeat-associated protein